MDQASTLYDRLGGYDAVTAVVNDLLPRLMQDEALGRFWAHRGDDGLQREKQLLIDFLCNRSGGPMYYAGRDMALAHRGMRISPSDWDRFMEHVRQCLSSFELPEAERADVISFIESTKGEIVEE